MGACLLLANPPFWAIPGCHQKQDDFFCSQWATIPTRWAVFILAQGAVIGQIPLLMLRRSLGLNEYPNLQLSEGTKFCKPSEQLFAKVRFCTISQFKCSHRLESMHRSVWGEGSNCSQQESAHGQGLFQFLFPKSHSLGVEVVVVVSFLIVVEVQEHANYMSQGTLPLRYWFRLCQCFPKFLVLGPTLLNDTLLGLT